MNRSLWIIGAALVGVVAGALILKTYITLAAPAFDCIAPRHHCIKVTVDPTSNTLSVDSERLKKTGRDHVIQWIIDNGPEQRYLFPNNGIAFAGAGGAEFNCQIDNSDARYFQCGDANGKPGTYKYTVRVIGNPQPAPLDLDPYIVNN